MNALPHGRATAPAAYVTTRF